jgi:hypothetical protein
MLSCRYEMSLSRFTAYSPFEISCFLAVTSMRYPCEILRFMLHNFRARYLDEIFCFFGPFTSFVYEISCLFGRCPMS